MKTWIFFAVAGLFFLSFLPGGHAAENACVNCHRDQPAGTFIGAKYQAWKESVHAREGITCDRCHGGKPAAAQKGEAHTGVTNSGNPLSRVYFKNVPGTCGACHRRDFNFFSRSTHYSVLEKTGSGPTCVTCHESHSTRIISPQQLPQTCGQCHNERMGIHPQIPTQAQALLLLIEETSLLLRYTPERTPAARGKSGGEGELADRMGTVRDQWHAFKLSQVQEQILQIFDRLKNSMPRGK